MVGLIKTQAGSLVAALALCALPLGGRQTQRIPALGAVRLAGGSDGLSITATSFDGSITTWLAEAEADGEVAVRLEGLADLVRHFPADAEIAIAADDRAATVTSGRSRFKLPVFPIADLLEPRILGEETGRVELDAKIARDLFARPVFAAATDESRLYLNGVFLHNAGDDLAAVATDGFRLCRVTAPVATSLSTDRSLIIPNEMVKAINRLLGTASGNVTLRRSERLFAVEGTGFALVTKRIDATYPDLRGAACEDEPESLAWPRHRRASSRGKPASAQKPRTACRKLEKCLRLRAHTWPQAIACGASSTLRHRRGARGANH